MTKIKTMKLISLILIAFILFSFTQDKEEKLEINIKNLCGAYGGDEETENAHFGIYEDVIYYPDADLELKYELRKDTIITIDSEKNMGKWLILKLTTDSLVFYDINYDLKTSLNRRKK